MPPGQMTCLQRSGLRAPLPSALSEAGSPASQVVRNWVFSTGFQGKSWGVAVHPHMYAPCVCRQTQSNTQTQGHSHGHKNTPRHFRTPVFMAEACVLWRLHMHTCRARICTHPCSQARPGAQAHTRRPITTQTHPEPGGRGSLVPFPPTHPPPAAGPFFCNSCIYFTVLSIGRGFQNTLGLFTELCKNILSPLQLSLPEGSGTCPSLHWANCAPSQQQPQLLKGPAGLTLRVRRWGLGEGPAGQRLVALPPWLLAPNTGSLLT